MSKKIITAVAAATLGAASLSAPVYAETSASFTVANQYLFRGMNANAGSALVAGDLSYANSGFTAGIWTGNAAGSNEIDLYASYGNEYKDVSYEVGVIKYVYPDNADTEVWHESGNNDETYVALGYSDFSFSFYVNNNDGDETYTTLGYSGIDKVDVTLGWVDAGDPQELATGNLQGQLPAATTNDVYTHLDVTYNVNDNFSFTASQIVNRDDGLDDSAATATSPAGANIDDDLNIVVTYSMPIEL